MLFKRSAHRKTVLSYVDISLQIFSLKKVSGILKKFEGFVPFMPVFYLSNYILKEFIGNFCFLH